MSAALASIDAALAVVVRDVKTMLSYRLRLVTTLLSVFFSLTLFYYISRLVTVGEFASPDEYYAFAVIGLIILQVITAVLHVPPSTLRQELVAGTFERIVLSPFGATGGALAMLVFPFVLTLVTSTAMLLFAALVFGVPIEVDTVVLALPVAVLAGLAFAPFGLLFLAAALVVKQAVGGATWVIALISLVAGLYFPATLLPDWIEWTSEVQPFTPAVELLRNVMVGTEMEDSAWLNLAKLVGFSVLLVPPATLLVSRAVQASRRRGTIIEY